MNNTAGEQVTETDQVMQVTSSSELKGLSKSQKDTITKLVLTGDDWLKNIEVSGFPRIKELQIENGHLQNVNTLNIKECGALHEVHIGNDCLNGRDERRNNSIVSIDCPDLEITEIGSGSCLHVTEFKTGSGVMKTFSHGANSLTECAAISLSSSLFRSFIEYSGQYQGIQSWRYQIDMREG